MTLGDAKLPCDLLVRQPLDLRELEARYTAAARRANVAQAEAVLPELRAGIVASREEHWEIGPEIAMAVPLFDWGQGAVGAAEAHMRRFRALYTARGVRVRSEVRAVRDRLLTLARTATHYAQVLVPLRAQIVAETLRQAYRWLKLGCEVGMYPYVIPFSGAALARDPQLAPQTHHARWQVAGTRVEWDQPVKILPIDSTVREVILRIERDFEQMLAFFEQHLAHLPSRVRSLI